MTRSALPARRTSSATANTSACARSRALAGAKSPRQTLTRSCTERCCSTRLFRTRTCMDAEPCLVAMSRAGIWHVHATCAEAMPCRSWCEAQHPGIVPIQQAYATSLTSSSPVAAPRGAPVSSQSWLIHDGNSFILAPTIQHLMECDTARPQITRYLRVVRMMWHTGAHPALLPDLQNQVCIRFSLREQQRPGQCLSCSACSVKARAWYPTGVLCACLEQQLLQERDAAPVLEVGGVHRRRALSRDQRLQHLPVRRQVLCSNLHMHFTSSRECTRGLCSEDAIAC